MEEILKAILGTLFFSVASVFKLLVASAEIEHILQITFE